MDAVDFNGAATDTSGGGGTLAGPVVVAVVTVLDT